LTALADLLEQLIVELDAGRDQLLRAIRGLGEEQMTLPLAPRGWSIRDILAHVASWDELRWFEIARTARGDLPIYHRMRDEEFDRWNELMMAYRTDLPLDQVTRELACSRRKVLEMVSSLTDEQLERAAEGRLRIRRAAAHDREHAEQIREWRQRERL